MARHSESNHGLSGRSFDWTVRSQLTAAAAAGGFAAEVGRGQQILQHAGRVNFGPTVRRSDILVTMEVSGNAVNTAIPVR